MGRRRLLASLRPDLDIVGQTGLDQKERSRRLRSPKYGLSERWARSRAGARTESPAPRDAPDRPRELQVVNRHGACTTSTRRPVHERPSTRRAGGSLGTGQTSHPPGTAPQRSWVLRVRFRNSTREKGSLLGTFFDNRSQSPNATESFRVYRTTDAPRGLWTDARSRRPADVSSPRPAIWLRLRGGFRLC